MAYDWLRGRHPSRAAKEYLEILHLAARESEAAVDDAQSRLRGGYENSTSSCAPKSHMPKKLLTAPYVYSIQKAAI
jgi:hypothetical protein